MRVTYKPEDGDVQQWDFEPGRVRAGEAEIVEKKYGDTWDTFCKDVSRGSVRARRVLLWHLTRRQHPKLRFEDTPDFFADELLVEHSRAELQALRDRLMKANIPPDELEQILTALDIEITEAMEGEDGGKAPSSSVGAATG